MTANVYNPGAPVVKWKDQTVESPVVPGPASWGAHPQTVRDHVSNKMESEGGHSGLSTDLQTCILALAHMNRHTHYTHTRWRQMVGIEDSYGGIYCLKSDKSDICVYSSLFKG